MQVLQVLEGLKLTADQFIDMCILCGCDYCGTIRGAYLRSDNPCKGMAWGFYNHLHSIFPAISVEALFNYIVNVILTTSHVPFMMGKQLWFSRAKSSADASG